MPSENFQYKDVYPPEEIEKLLQPPKRLTILLDNLSAISTSCSAHNMCSLF